MEKVLIYPVSSNMLHFYLNTINWNIINSENTEEEIISLSDNSWLLELNNQFFNNLILISNLKQATEDEKLELELTIDFLEKLKLQENEKWNELNKICIRKQTSLEDTKFYIKDLSELKI